MFRLLTAAVLAALLTPAAYAGEFVVVNRCDAVTKFEVVNRCGPATPAVQPVQPVVQPQAPAKSAALCGCAIFGGNCPTPGFCGGEGCTCGKTAAAGVAAGPFVNPPADSFVTPATTARTAGTRLLGRGRNAAPAQSQGLTYTLVPGAAGSGFTSGCPNGRCPNAQYSR
jgi:hypothetical protein